MRDPLSKAEHYRKLAVKYRELAKFAQPAYLGDFYRGIAVRYAFMAQEASERGNNEVRPEPFNPQGQAEDVALDVRKRREEVGGGLALKREPRKVRDGGVLVRIGLRSTSAVMAAQQGKIGLHPRRIGCVFRHGDGLKLGALMPPIFRQASEARYPQPRACYISLSPHLWHLRNQIGIATRLKRSVATSTEATGV